MTAASKASGAHAYKKLAYGLMAVVAFLAVPLAVQALSGPSPADPSDERATSSEQRKKTSSNGEASGQAPDPYRDAPPYAGSGPASSSVKVTVDGQAIPVPQNGSFHRTFSGTDNQNVVEVSVQNGQSANANVQGYSSTIEINSSSPGTSTDRADSRERDHDHDRDR